MKNKGVLLTVQAAMIAAIYVVLMVVFAPIGSGAIQVRISEALTILPVFTPAAVPGVFIGCVLGNLFTGAMVPDIVFGSLATLIGAVFTYLLRNKSRFLAPIPPIAANVLIIPFVLRYAYGEPLPIPFLMATIGAGEIISCGVLGILLAKVLGKYQYHIFRTQPVNVTK